MACARVIPGDRGQLASVILVLSAGFREGQGQCGSTGPKESHRCTAVTAWVKGWGRGLAGNFQNTQGRTQERTRQLYPPARPTRSGKSHQKWEVAHPPAALPAGRGWGWRPQRAAVGAQKGKGQVWVGLWTITWGRTVTTTYMTTGY